MAEAARAADAIQRTAIPLGGSPGMDREFIERHQIIERYFANKLPARGALDLERYCRAHPELLEDLRIAERVHAGVRLLEAGGVALPWEERPRRFWERLPFVATLSVLALVAATAAVVYMDRFDADEGMLAALRSQIAAQPLDPVQATRSIKIAVDRDGPAGKPALTVENSRGLLAELKFQLDWSAFSHFRITMDRVHQGRVMVLNGMQRDSNGELRVAINTHLLGPGIYQFQIEGQSQRGDGYVPQGWASIAVTH